MESNTPPTRMRIHVCTVPSVESEDWEFPANIMAAVFRFRPGVALEKLEDIRWLYYI